MASGPEGTELLNYQTSVLKVSIHCEGCKKKVRKVLQGLEGVYAIDINSKQNKVIVTGSVDAESLIRRLVKYGKHAELWPEKKPTVANSSSEAAGDAKVEAAAAASAPKTEQPLPNSEKQQQTEEGKNKTTSANPTEATATSQAAAAAAAIPGEDSASKSNIDAPKCNDGDKQANSDKKDSEKPPIAFEAGADEKVDDSKMGKKAHMETSSIHESAVSDSDTADKAAATAAAVSPPPPKQFPVYSQPAYTVSYSAVQPSTSYAYYTPSPAATPSSYAYSGYPPPSTHPQDNYSSDPYYGSMEEPATPGGSYDMFNDENPNACNLM